MKKILFTLLTLATIITFSIPAKADTYQQNYAKLPKRVTDVLTEDGWVILEEKNLAQKFGFNRKIMALTRFQEHIIYLEPRKQDDALLHECMHAMDEHYFETLGWYPSCDPQLELIRQEECMTMVNAFPTSKYNYNTAEEYWAEAGQNTVLYPDWMAKHCPLTYDYMVTYIY